VVTSTSNLFLPSQQGNRPQLRDSLVVFFVFGQN